MTAAKQFILKNSVGIAFAVFDFVTQNSLVFSGLLLLVLDPGSEAGMTKKFVSGLLLLVLDPGSEAGMTSECI